MQTQKLLTYNLGSFISGKAKDYAQLSKMRLASIVVLSAIIGFLMGIESMVFLDLVALAFGGFFITAASNALNQILERDVDKLMKRTASRPLPTQRMTVVEASVVAGIMAVSGIAILTFYFNPTAGALAAIALISYAFIYTPMKRISPIAVLIGAFPGALPPMIGYICASGQITELAILLFSIQFLWQFPHFWSIAWVSFEDYKKAGIMLLPSKSGKSKYNAALNVAYILVMIPVGLMPFILNYVGLIGSGVILLATIGFLIPAIQLLRKCDDTSARKLMFASFFYLPVVLFSMILDKI